MPAFSSLWPFPVLGERHHERLQQLQNGKQLSADLSAVISGPSMAETHFPRLEPSVGPRQSFSSTVPAPVQRDNVQLDSACNMYGESVVLISTDEEIVALSEGRPGSVSHAAGVSPKLIDARPVFASQWSSFPLMKRLWRSQRADQEALPQQQPGCLAWPPPAHACELAGIHIEVTPAAAADTAPMQGRRLHLDHDSAEILHGSPSQGSFQSARSQYCKTSVEAFQLGLPGVPRTQVRDAFLRNNSCHLGAASRGMHITFQASPSSLDLLAWHVHFCDTC